MGGYPIKISIKIVLPGHEEAIGIVGFQVHPSR
jgi:hypothetical protein